MDLILCHTTADFDTLGAAVGLTRLHPGSRIVLTGGCHPGVREFLALHRDEYPLIERRSVNPGAIRSLTIVDTQLRDRLGKAREWLDLPLPIYLWDHHFTEHSDIPATETHIEAVGAATTLIVEQLQKATENAEFTTERKPDPHSPFLIPPPNNPHSAIISVAEATVMALGIHVDTGSLTFHHSTPRDANALGWLMQQGASLSAIAEYVEPALSGQLQDLLATTLDRLETETLEGYTVSSVMLESEDYVPGLSSLAGRAIDLTESDALLLGHRFPLKDGEEERLTVIGRSRIPGTNLKTLFQPWGGGGHPRAASLTRRDTQACATFAQLLDHFKQQIPPPPVARELMSSPVRTIRPETTIHEAQRILLRYGHSGLSVVDAEGFLVGVISRRDIDIALHHGFSHAPVKGYMSANLKTIDPQTPLPEIEEIMVTYDVGRLPVLDRGKLQGIVTRTDVLRQLHHENATTKKPSFPSPVAPYCPLPQSLEQLLSRRLAPPLWHLLDRAAQLAQERGWHLYLVGGAVRDVLVNATQDGGQIEVAAAPQSESPLLLTDIDMVVDGYHRAADAGAGVELAKALQKQYPEARLDTHGQFQTAALLWHKDPVLDSLWIDIATARTEFYPYPAANPEVEASSIRQDLYRRDFTINALAVRLTGTNRRGEMLDFFGGWLDLQDRRIRVLHANSFIEDPTRIYRAVRFAVRLGFEIEPQTQGYIRLAIESGIYELSATENRRVPALETRLKSELKYILQAPYWKPALELLGSFDALRCIHPSLAFDRDLWRKLQLVDRWIRSLGVVVKENGALKGSKRGKNQSAKQVFHLPAYWEIRLEVIIAHLAPAYRGEVARNLQLSAQSIDRLEGLAAASAQVTQVREAQRPSDLVRLLKGYDVAMLMLIALNAARSLRRRIWEYVTRWADAKPLLNGNDLKRLGYKPGPHFKDMLDVVLAATVDGEIRDRAQAEALVAKRFPRP
ncbi:CBS domain-containing protein [Phormidium sp. CCY1219]|uniref:CBS domain-containing protein n=1 Tax=Phormidium sp. CCY1219 TaxID=2886104 RepID=UPI002D1F7273|nr:CBS domain-containing protein [Phormidium sp. CCY1219]MEB3829248.1 CBS domain-containing protein [Phormidium sp. CCY1219]